MEKAVDSERERKKMSKKVILSALQSGKAGVFSDQPLTRLMVIFLHRRRFTAKASSSHALSLSFLLSSLSVSLWSLHLLSPVTDVPYAAPYHFCFSMLTVLFFLAHYPPQPPNAAVSNLPTSNSPFFRARFPCFCLMVQFSSHLQTMHTYIHTHTRTNYSTSNDELNSFIRILQ